MDSEFYDLLKRLARRDLEWRPAETEAEWLGRVRRVAGDALADILREIHALHLRYRFDPAGLGSTERARLRELAVRARAELERFVAGAR